MAISDQLETLNQDIISGVMLVIGLVFAFFGAIWFKKIIFFIGFVIGGLVGWIIVHDLRVTTNWNITDETILYISLATGAVLGFALVLLYKLAVFTTGAIFGIILATIIWRVVLSIEPDPPSANLLRFALIAIFAVGFGLLAFCFVKQVLKTVTAFIGGFFFAAALAYFIQRITGKTNSGIFHVFFSDFKKDFKKNHYF